MLSEVLDISTAQVPPGSLIGVDSNFLILVGSPRAGRAAPEYSNFLANSLRLSARLFRSCFVDIELAYTLEKLEFDFRSPGGNFKAFRSNPTNKQILQSALSSFFLQVSSYSDRIVSGLDNTIIDKTIHRQQNELVDAMDALIIESYLAEGITHVISDDADFVNYHSGVTVLTANRRLLSRARNEGMLRPRF